MSGTGPIYYIGDVHGRADLLRVMLKMIESLARSRGHAPIIHFLGDIVDRGPESCAAMDLVHATLKKHPGSLLHLGNHDQWFLEAIDTDGEFGDCDSWVLHGGYQTVQSYTPLTDPKKIFDYIRAFYPHHVTMLREARRYSENGPLFACHAGIDPRWDLELLKKGEFRGIDPFLWIRDPFLLHADDTATPVIHGHTIVGSLPVVTENRISIDTGAYHSGRLTVCIMDPEIGEMTFIQTDPEDLGGVNQVTPKIVDRGKGTIYDRLPELFANWYLKAAA